MVSMPILLDCPIAEPCPDGGYIDKDHLIKWLLDVLEQAGQDKNLAIAYIVDLHQYLCGE